MSRASTFSSLYRTASKTERWHQQKHFLPLRVDLNAVLVFVLIFLVLPWRSDTRGGGRHDLGPCE